MTPSDRWPSGPGEMSGLIGRGKAANYLTAAQTENRAVGGSIPPLAIP
jgi:hypothetical protein